MTYSEKIANAMKDKGISIRELSDITGIPKSAIQRYTSGTTDSIPIDRMQLMAEALSINPAFVMGWAESSEPIRKTFSSYSPAAKKLREIGRALAPASVESAEEQELIDIFRDLNETGQQTLLGTARGLSANPAMKKAGASNDALA